MRPVNARNNGSRLITAWEFFDVDCPECGTRVGKPCIATIGAYGAGATGMPIRGVHAKRLPIAECTP